jgi:hypothetical protein
MRYTARLNRTPSGFAAECIELDALGEGRTREAAIRSLKGELEDQLSHVEGMAPPAVASAVSVELVILDDAETAASPKGPPAVPIPSE